MSAKLPKLAVICETVPAIGARKGKVAVGCNRSIHHAVNRLAHLQIYRINLFLRERNIIKIPLFMFLLMSVFGIMSLCSGVV